MAEGESGVEASLNYMVNSGLYETLNQKCNHSLKFSGHQFSFCVNTGKGANVTNLGREGLPRVALSDKAVKFQFFFFKESTTFTDYRIIANDFLVACVV